VAALAVDALFRCAMLTLVDILSADQQRSLRDYLDQHHRLLEADSSHYALGRQRFWLEHQPVLGSFGKRYEPAVRLPWLWRFCQDMYHQAVTKVAIAPPPQAVFGLAAYGPVGIKSHRDDTYAACPAMSINLSTQPTLWGYVSAYSDYEHRQPKSVPEQIHTLPPGAVILFNSKNLHRVVEADAKRWSLNIWSLAPKCEPYFQSYLADQRSSSCNIFS
jgi:hypothetical protein